MALNVGLLHLACAWVFYTIVERKWSMARRKSTRMLDVVPFHEYSHRAWTQRGDIRRQRHWRDGVGVEIG